MSYLAKQKLIYYKKYKIDIWGFVRNTLQVLHDNTIYNLFSIAKYQKKLESAFKQTSWEYFKWKFNVQRDRKLYNLKKIDFETFKTTKKNFRILKRSRYKKIVNLICLNNLLSIFMPNTITKRLCKVFNILLIKKAMETRIFFRRPFIYEPRIPTIRQRKRRVNEQFVSFRIIKLFYVMYNYKQLKKIARKAKLQSGIFEQNYLSIIESKLPSYIYRTSFFPTIFDSLHFVKSGNVWVNKKFKPLTYYTVKLFDIVGFRILYKNYILWSFFKRIRRKAFLFVFSKCIFVSFHFLFTVLIARFTKMDIVNAFTFDYYRIANYAQ